MIATTDIWNTLAAARPQCRVVLRLECGDEIDLSSMDHHAGLIVLRAVTPIGYVVPDAEKLEEYRPVLEEFNRLDPTTLRELCKSTPASFDDMTEMLSLLHGADITTPVELLELLERSE